MSTETLGTYTTITSTCATGAKHTAPSFEESVVAYLLNVSNGARVVFIFLIQFLMNHVLSSKGTVLILVNDSLQFAMILG